MRVNDLIKTQGGEKENLITWIYKVHGFIKFITFTTEVITMQHRRQMLSQNVGIQEVMTIRKKNPKTHTQKFRTA